MDVVCQPLTCPGKLQEFGNVTRLFSLVHMQHRKQSSSQNSLAHETNFYHYVTGSGKIQHLADSNKVEILFINFIMSKLTSLPSMNIYNRIVSELQHF